MKSHLVPHSTFPENIHEVHCYPDSSKLLFPPHIDNVVCSIENTWDFDSRPIICTTNVVWTVRILVSRNQSFLIDITHGSHFTITDLHIYIGIVNISSNHIYPDWNCVYTSIIKISICLGIFTEFQIIECTLCSGHIYLLGELHCPFPFELRVSLPYQFWLYMTLFI